MLGLMIVAIVLIVYYCPKIISLEDEYQYIQLAIMGVGFLSILIVIVFFLVFLKSYKNYFYSWIVYKWVTSKLPQKISTLINRIVDAFDLFKNNIKIIFKAILFSILVHIWLGANLFFVGKCVDEKMLKFSEYLLATQVSNLIAIIPITPGGIGIRDIGTASLLKIFGALPQMAGIITILMTFIIVFWRFVGCGFFIVCNLSNKDT
jgi:uncharacterized protein (TIRG00374 family)